MKRLSIGGPLALYEAGAPVTDSVATLVLGHALGSNRHMWDQVLPLLPSDLRVIIWEQPGHGNSDVLPDHVGGVGATAQRLGQALTALGIDSVHIAGLSLGGTTSLAFAQQFPARTLSLTMLSSGAAMPPFSQWEQRAQQVETQGLETLVDATMDRWFSDEFRLVTGTQAVNVTRQVFQGTNPQGYAHCCRLIAATDLRNDLNKFAGPTRLVVGGDDPGMTPDQAAELARGMQDTTVEVIAGAKHLSAVERPEEVADALVRAVRPTPN